MKKKSFYCNKLKKKVIIITTVQGRLINDCLKCYKKDMHQVYNNVVVCQKEHGGKND